MLGLIVRFVISTIVLLCLGLFVPGFRVAGFTGALIVALVIALLGYAIEKLFGNKSSRLGQD